MITSTFLEFRSTGNMFPILIHLTTFKSLYMLNSAQRPNLTGYPSLTCSFAANYHLNFPQPAPIWPCSLVGRVSEVVGSNPLGLRDFSFSAWAHFLSRANAQKVLFGIFFRTLQFTIFKPLYISSVHW